MEHCDTTRILGNLGTRKQTICFLFIFGTTANLQARHSTRTVKLSDGSFK